MNGADRRAVAGLTLAAAALVVTAARPWAHGAAAWVGFALLLLALLRVPTRTRGASRAGAVVTATMGGALGLLAFEGVAPPAPFAYAALVALTALPWAAVGLAFARVRARHGDVAATTLLPVLVVALEWIVSRRFLFGDAANAIAAVGVTQFGTPLARAAAWSGLSAVTFALLAIAVALAWLVRRTRPPAWAALCVAAMLLPAVVGAPGRFTVAGEGATLRTAVAQGAVPSIDTLFARFDADAAGRLLATYAELTAGARERGAELVVWGETVIPQPLAPGEFPAALERALAAAPAALVGGVSRVGGNLHNAVFHYADGALVEVYRKRVLVPLNERAYTAGVALPALDVAGVGIGMGVCLDAVVASVMRDAVLGGAEILVVLTEDGFAGRTLTPELHLRHAAFRAIETGRYLVFANQSGPSAIVAPTGRVMQRIPHGVRGGIVADVPALAGVTPFTRFGDAFGMVAVLIVAAAFAIPAGDRRA